MRDRVLRVRDLLCGYPQPVFRFYGQHLGLHGFLVFDERQRARERAEERANNKALLATSGGNSFEYH